jgi:Cu-Zn family superoxide dismutase
MHKVVGIAVFLFAIPASAQEAPKAKAELRDSKGKSVGTATLEQTNTGVLITVEAEGLKDGAKGFHLHETGKCKPPDFKSAGGHLNPEKRGHGYHSERGRHAGDLPNLWVKDGKAKATHFNEKVSLYPDVPNTLFDKDGTALVVHAGPDDYKTDPAGASGDRVACGVIVPETK